MIAKCLAILAVVAQISASGCNQQTVVLPSCGSSSQAARIAVVSASSSGCEGSTAGAVTRNVVAKGKYPVALRNCGPTPDRQIPVTSSASTAPAQLKPLVRLPSKIPAPRTIAHSCTCYKTIVRPRVHQHIVTVPTVERYLETTHKPVIENIQYEAIPVNCEETVSSSCSGSEYQFVSQSGSQVQTVEAPRVERVQVVEAPRVERVQVVEAPRVERVQVVEAPRVQVQTVEAPRVEYVEAPRVERVQVQTVEAPRVQVVEAPRVEYVEAPRVEAQRVQVVEAPRVQVVEAQRVQIPQTYSFGCQQ